MKIKQCPKCGTEFDYRIQFCFRDGHSLKNSDKSEHNSKQIIDHDKSTQLEDIDFTEITQDITLVDLLDIQGISMGIDILGIDLNEASRDLDSDFMSMDKEWNNSSDQSQELGVNFGMAEEFDSDDLSDEVSEELDFDEFENTLDLDVAQLMSGLETERNDQVASPLSDADGLKIPMSIKQAKMDALLPGDTLDLELDLETVEDILELKAAEKRKKLNVNVATEGKAPTSRLFLVAIFLGIVGSVFAISFMNDKNKGDIKQTQNIENYVVKETEEILKTVVSPEKNQNEVQVEDQPTENVVEKPIEKPVEKLVEKSVEKPVKNPVKKPVKQVSSKQSRKVETKVVKVKDPAPMKLPTEPVPDKEKIIPSPKISKPVVTPKIKKQPEAKIEKTVVDESVSLWGADPTTDCYIIFDSNASGASVFLDGRRFGKVGDKIKVECNKKYNAKLQADGYIDNTRSVQSDGTKNFFLELSK